MGLDILLNSARKRRGMSGMKRGERLANCTNRHCLHLSLSVSVSALEDGLISSAPGLRFKHLSALPFPSSSSVSQPVSPLLHASITGISKLWDTLYGSDLKDFYGEMDGWTGCLPSGLKGIETTRAL